MVPESIANRDAGKCISANMDSFLLAVNKILPPAGITGARVATSGKGLDDCGLYSKHELKSPTVIWPAMEPLVSFGSLLCRDRWSSASFVEFSNDCPLQPPKLTNAKVIGI